MAPSAVDERGFMTNGHGVNGAAKVDRMNPHEQVHFDPSLKPKSYHIKGTDPNSKILFRDVNIIDSTGADPFRGDVYIEGDPLLSLPNLPRRTSLTVNRIRRTHHPRRPRPLRLHPPARPLRPHHPRPRPHPNVRPRRRPHAL
jgi:hypothetical protein